MRKFIHKLKTFYLLNFKPVFPGNTWINKQIIWIKIKWRLRTAFKNEFNSNYNMVSGFDLALLSKKRRTKYLERLRDLRTKSHNNDL